MTGSCRAAWVPADSNIDLDQAAALAMRWIGNECQEWSTNTILLTKPNVAPPVVTLLEDFVQRQTQSVSNCDRDGSSPANYPVLVYDPDPETLGCAIELAEGSCLCAI